MASISKYAPENIIANHNRAAQAQREFDRRAQLLRERLVDEDFLANKGIGNEIGFYTFCYDPALEFQTRALFKELQTQSQAGQLTCTVKLVDLYDTALRILEGRRILGAVPRQEERRGTQKVQTDMARFCAPEKIAEAILEQAGPFDPGDVLLITGVGKIYPWCRLHDLFNCMQVDFASLPVVAAFPGIFNGQSFRLFNVLPADNYYRALDIS